MERKVTYLLLLTAVLFAACAETPDEQHASLRKKVPSVTGGFTYKQYVIVNPGDPEVLGDEGVLYISPTMFTESQLQRIGTTELGKDELENSRYSVADGLLNMCFSARSVDKGKAGSAAMYSRLVISWARDIKGKTELTVYSWPDAWYFWSLKKADNQIIAEDPSVEHDFGWQSSRIILTPDSSIDLDKCIEHSQLQW